MPLILQVPSLNLLQLHFRLGRRSRFPRPLPALDLLPCHGHRALQPLPSLLAPRPLREVLTARKESRLVDSTYRDHLHGLLLVPLRLLPPLARSPRLDHPRHLRPGLPHHHHAAPRANHPLPLGNVNRRPRRDRVLRPAPAPHHHGRRLPRVDGLCARRSPVPGRSPLVPTCAAP